MIGYRVVFKNIYRLGGFMQPTSAVTVRCTLQDAKTQVKKFLRALPEVEKDPTEVVRALFAVQQPPTENHFINPLLQENVTLLHILLNEPELILQDERDIPLIKEYILNKIAKQIDDISQSILNSTQAEINIYGSYKMDLGVEQEPKIIDYYKIHHQGQTKKHMMDAFMADWTEKNVANSMKFIFQMPLENPKNSLILFPEFAKGDSHNLAEIIREIKARYEENYATLSKKETRAMVEKLTTTLRGFGKDAILQKIDHFKRDYSAEGQARRERTLDLMTAMYAVLVKFNAPHYKFVVPVLLSFIDHTNLTEAQYRELTPNSVGKSMVLALRAIKESFLFEQVCIVMYKKESAESDAAGYADLFAIFGVTVGYNSDVHSESETPRVVYTDNSTIKSNTGGFSLESAQSIILEEISL